MLRHYGTQLVRTLPARQPAIPVAPSSRRRPVEVRSPLPSAAGCCVRSARVPSPRNRSRATRARFLARARSRGRSGRSRLCRTCSHSPRLPVPVGVRGCGSWRSLAALRRACRVEVQGHRHRRRDRDSAGVRGRPTRRGTPHRTTEVRRRPPHRHDSLCCRSGDRRTPLLTGAFPGDAAVR